MPWVLAHTLQLSPWLALNGRRLKALYIRPQITVYYSKELRLSFTTNLHKEYLLYGKATFYRNGMEAIEFVKRKYEDLEVIAKELPQHGLLREKNPKPVCYVCTKQPKN